MEQAFEVTTDEEKIAELKAIIDAVRERSRAHYPEGQTDGPGIRIALADLLPVVHARDAAQAKIAAIGAVNPRAGGIANRLIQAVKKLVARSLQWFVRDQIVFNREAISAVEALIEALNDHNRALVSLAAQTNDRFASAGHDLSEQMHQFRSGTSETLQSVIARMEALHAQTELLKAETLELKDIRRHWAEWRVAWEQKLATNEVQFLRSVADLQIAFQHRASQMESNFREMVRAQHRDYLGALDRTTLDIHKQHEADFHHARTEFDRMIHAELRLIRQRTAVAFPPAAPQAVPAASPPLDYSRFAERFRGPEAHVRASQEFYKPVFARCAAVLDLGCGRGEFLATMRDAGIDARGIDLSAENIAQCREKDLHAEQADLFEYLNALPDGELDGIMCSQVVEHLPPDRLPEMVNLCAAKLARGGVMAVETPDPSCLAIFATYFYLDPTHVRPVPHSLMAFYMEEAGLAGTRVTRLSPAEETFPELASLPQDFRERFFGGMDYAIVGHKL